MSDNQSDAASRRGLLWGLVGVVIFSFTLPATRVAVPEMGAVFVGLGRALVAGVLAVVLVAVRGDRPPERRHWPGLAFVSLGVVFGFPLLTAFALRSLPASHGAVIVGLIPAATAVMAVVRAGERPPLLFWIGCVGGVVAVLVFAVVEGAGSPQPADLLLFVAVVLVGAGYAEGGRLSREMAPWRVICWSLIGSIPLLVVPVALAVGDGFRASPQAWIGFAWVACMSMFGGFFAWYRGLALGGVARVGQLQLLQPVLAVGWSALFLGEVVSLPTVLAALLVVGAAGVCIRLGRVRRTDAEPPSP